ncbi:MAG: flagellar motor protein MotD [Candidatus Accumulibacter sp.]|jgi:chemotaxis protein MotB|nr:flagellar motor protein MotD [Accumulibacter sp.]
MRKRREESHENLERWLVSYADFITLMFAFFVVMYALSSINEEKYRLLSTSLGTAFRNVDYAPEGTVPLPVILPPIPLIPKPPPPETATEDAQTTARRTQRQMIRNVAGDIRGVMGALIEQGVVRVLETGRGMSIEISDSILFPQGQSSLQPQLVQVLRAIAELLVSTDFNIIIEGHTDNTPISTAQFPSNWELSAVRATTVLRLFTEVGIAPERLTAIGYADTRPVEPNLLAEGRAKNRRVTILVDSTPPERSEEIGLNAPAG